MGAVVVVVTEYDRGHYSFFKPLELSKTLSSTFFVRIAGHMNSCIFPYIYTT